MISSLLYKILFTLSWIEKNLTLQRFVLIMAVLIIIGVFSVVLSDD